MQEEHEKAVKPVSFRLSSLLLLAGKEKRSSFCNEVAETWAVSHRLGRSACPSPVTAEDGNEALA